MRACSGRIPLQTRRRLPGRSGPRPNRLPVRPEFGYVVGVDIGANKLLVTWSDLSGACSPPGGSRRGGPGAHRPCWPRSAARSRPCSPRSASPRRGQGDRGGTPGVVDPATSRVSLAPQIAGWETRTSSRRLGAGSRGGWVEPEVHCRCSRSAGTVRVGAWTTWCTQRRNRHRGGHPAVATATAGRRGHRARPATCPSSTQGPGRRGEVRPLRVRRRWWRLRAARRDAARTPGGRGSATGGRRPGRGRCGGRVRPLRPRAIRRRWPSWTSWWGAWRAAWRSVATVVDPSVVVIGGGLSRAGEPLRSRLEQDVQRLLPRPPRILLSALGEGGSRWAP